MNYRIKEINTDNKPVTPNKYSMEYLILRYFFENMDIFDEFQMIVHEFLKHEFGNLNFYHDIDYGEDTPKGGSKVAVYSWKRQQSM